MKYIKLFEQMSFSTQSVEDVISEYMKFFYEGSNNENLYKYKISKGIKIIPLEGWTELGVEPQGDDGSCYSSRDIEDPTITIYSSPFYDNEDYISAQYYIDGIGDVDDVQEVPGKNVAHEFFGLNEQEFREKAIEVTLEYFFKGLALLVKNLTEKGVIKNPRDLETVIGPEWEWFTENMNDEEAIMDLIRARIRALSPNLKTRIIRSGMF